MHWIDPDHLPATHGTLERFVPNGHGAIDGMLLTDGTEIHTPPHLSAALARAIEPGARLAVRGLAVRGANVIVAVAIDPPKGKRILDEGPREGAHHDKPPKDDERWAYEGRIERRLHGPKGSVHGVLLEDGVVFRIPPHAADPLDRLLATGNHVAAEGRWLDTPHGAVLVADAIGPRADAVAPMPKKPGH
ncbi:hypothetical protein [Luteibacter sp. CQ10]|uniref:hypothetical protein n=1 Tax=Luteibacter sp. CQ10 TaxID=2805821 RepID=UPI0034A12CE7